jgi:predicted transport protein
MDLKLFRIKNQKAEELEGRSAELEKELQILIEKNLDTFLGVRFLATEYSTGKKHGGRIDTLGLDENNSPVIIEYKRTLQENVINQGLFYMDWLLDHQAEFKLLVMEKLGQKPAENIEWSIPRLICVAGDFSRFDEHAIHQMNRNIELVRYRKYGEDYLMLEVVNAVSASSRVWEQETGANRKQKTVTELIKQTTGQLKSLYEELNTTLMEMGDDVHVKTLKYYVAYRRLKNFACVEIHPQNQSILVYTKVDPDSLDMESLGKDFVRDVRNIGHWGTGSLEIKIRDSQDLEKAKSLLIKSYELS